VEQVVDPQANRESPSEKDTELVDLELSGVDLTGIDLRRWKLPRAKFLKKTRLAHARPDRNARAGDAATIDGRVLNRLLSAVTIRNSRVRHSPRARPTSRP
jgi:hypothetical protein